MFSSDFHCSENDETTGTMLLRSKINFVLKSHRKCWNPNFKNTIITGDES